MTQMMKPLKDLVLLDRFLFAEAMEDPVIVRNVLEIILGDEILLLDTLQTEKELRTSPLLRSIRMDVFSMDEEKNIYNTEVQKKNTQNLPKRSRYYQALLDSSLLEPGVVDFNLLNNTYLIMIAPFDLFGQGKYRYTFQAACLECPNISLGDGAVKIFLNTKGMNDDEVSSELIELLHYIEQTSDEVNNNCTSIRIKEIHNRVSKIKISEEMGVRYMQAWEEKIYEREEGRTEGRTEGEFLKLISQVRRKFSKHISVEDSADMLEEKEEVVRKIYEAVREHPEWEDSRIYEGLIGQGRL